MLSCRIQRLQPSPTLSLDAKVKEMQAKGTTVINLTVGEPDFSTPAHIKQSAIAAINHNFTHYTPAAGIPELRAAIVKKLFKDNQLTYTPAQIIVGVGTKQLLYSVFQVICQKNDQVLIPTPTWSTYVEQVKLADAKPVTFAIKPPYILRAKMLNKYITSKTKAIIINSPCNPTGAVIPKAELKKIAQLCLKHNIYIISDEIYEKIIYQGSHFSIAAISEQIKNITITINGFSKSYAMTGWRVGYAAGPDDIIAGMIALAGQTTSGTCSISQYAAVSALAGGQTEVLRMQSEFRRRRDYLLREFAKIKQIKVLPPDGAFYLLLDVSHLLGKKYAHTSDWTQALLSEAGVALVPGEAFLAPGLVRLSFAASREKLRASMLRLKKFIGNL